MDAQLVATKYHSPPLSLGRVPRPHLLHQLDEGVRAGQRLILVSAPAGYGKTTLLLQWSARHRRCEAGAEIAAPAAEPGESSVVIDCAWLTLDLGDNDPLRFLTYLVAALQYVSPSSGRVTAALLQSADPSAVPSLLATLTNDIGSTSRHIAIILDDYHVISAQPIHDMLAYLIRYAPETLHFVISSRVDPPLPLARLRGSGQMSELRQQDLRFTAAEATQLLSAALAPAMSPAIVNLLTDRAEGWAAGLQMAALSLQGHSDPEGFVRAFSGSHRHILDYLSEEVFNSQPDAVQRFLTRTSILERLCAPLCEALLDEVAAPGHMQALLERLDQDNLFVVPLDSERCWYRYHHLFYDLLHQRLAINEPALIPVLHQRASEWFVAAGLMHEAVEHALLATNFEQAADLIVYMAESVIKSSEVATLRRWIDALPDEAVRARPLLGVYHGGALLLLGEPLADAEASLRAAFAAHPVGGTGGGAAAFQAMLATLQGQRQTSDRLAQRALSLLPEQSPFFRSCVSLVTGMNHLFSGNDTAAEAALHETIASSDPSGDIMNAVLSRCYLAELNLLRGRLRTTQMLYEQALMRSQEEPIGGLALMGLGRLYYDWNDLVRAEALLTTGLEKVSDWNDRPVTQGTLLLARIKYLTGERAAALQLEQRVDATLASHAEMTMVHRSLRLYRMRHALWRGDLPTADLHAALAGITGPLKDAQHTHISAQEESAGIGEQSIEGAFVLLCQAHHWLAHGHHAAAAAAAETLARRSLTRGWLRLTAKAEIAYARIAFAMRDERAAVAAMSSALTIAAPESSIRLFTDEGEEAAEILVLCLRRKLQTDYVTQLLDAFSPGQASAVPNRDSRQARAIKSIGDSSPVVEALSEREIQVLRLMADGHSNGEVADRLGIATSTVKSHVHAIFHKLNATRRTQAIAHARTHQLL